ncbi:MAG: hypothetical protein J0I06_13370 [Planctomycetes bacterium]|nr:hypothetical protein [Planctomycetota bacterium]
MSDYFFSSRPAFPWSVYPIGLPALGVVAALLVLFTVWTYLGHPQATRKRVLIVLVLRLAALAVTLLTAVRPSVGVNENPKQPSVLLVGVDVSESMTVKDEVGGQARIDAVRKTLERCQPLFDDLLAEHGINVVLYKFGPPDFNEATGRWDPSAPADAKRSDYGAYLYRVYERWQAEQRVRGHLVIGDGVDNGETFVAATEAARFGRRGVPVSTFLVGTDTSSDSKDIAVVGVECNPSPAFIKNDVLVTARVNAYNFAGSRVTARVSINDEPRHVEEFTLERDKGNELKMTVKAPDTKGEYKVKVEVGLDKDGKIVPLPGELSPLNNWSETYLTVNKEGVRVLIVDQLRWEETFLRDALRREKRFDVYEVFRQTDLVPTEGERALLNLEANAYDVVIVGNVSAAHLQKAAPDFLPKLAELIAKKGIGVMFLGGEYAFQGIPKDVLPIAGGPIVDVVDEKTGEVRQTYPAVPTGRGLEKMFRVSGKPGEAPRAGESEELWNRMNSGRTGMRLNGYNRLDLTDRERALYSVFAWTTPDPANGANPTFIAAGGDIKPGGEPLLVGSQRGDATKGRWLAFGAFDTYLWRSLGQLDWPKTDDGIKMHERFWRQCVLWLAHQDEEESQVYARPQFRQLKITSEQTVRVGMKKSDGGDDPTAPLTVRIVPLAPGQPEPKPEDEKKAPALTVLTDKDGRKVLFRAPAPGEYFVSVTAPARKPDGAPELNADGTPKLIRGTAKFIAVPDVSDEMLQVNANPQLMERLSLPTGGKALRLEDLPGFLKELKAEPPSDAGKKPRYYPDWHRNRSRGFLPLWLVVFALLLGAEWGLRRLLGMV